MFRFTSHIRIVQLIMVRDQALLSQMLSERNDLSITGEKIYTRSFR